MKLRRFDVIVALLIASILLPGVPIPGLFLIRFEEILMLVLLPVFLLWQHRRLTRIDLGFALVGLSIFISMLWGSVVLGITISPRDFMELVKVAKSWLFFRVAVFPWPDDKLVQIVKVFLISSAISGLVGIVQWQNWLGLGDVLSNIYVTGRNNLGTSRIFGTVGNAMYYGHLMVLGLIFVMYFWTYFARLKWRFISITVLSCCGMGLILSQSRSSILAIIAAIGISLLLNVPKLRYRSAWRALRRNRWILITIMLIVLTLTPWMWKQFQIMSTLRSSKAIANYRANPVNKFLYRFHRVDDSLEDRVNIKWARGWAGFKASPIFGWGPGKSEQTTSMDNGYLMTIRRYGIFGLLCFIYLIMQATRIILRPLHFMKNHSARTRFLHAQLSVISALLAANLFNEVFTHLQLLSLFWLLVGIASSSAFYLRFSSDPTGVS